MSNEKMLPVTGAEFAEVERLMAAYMANDGQAFVIGLRSALEAHGRLRELGPQLLPRLAAEAQARRETMDDLAEVLRRAGAEGNTLRKRVECLQIARDAAQAAERVRREEDAAIDRMLDERMVKEAGIMPRKPGESTLARLAAAYHWVRADATNERQNVRVEARRRAEADERASNLRAKLEAAEADLAALRAPVDVEGEVGSATWEMLDAESGIDGYGHGSAAYNRVEVVVRRYLEERAQLAREAEGLRASHKAAIDALGTMSAGRDRALADLTAARAEIGRLARENAETIEQRENLLAEVERLRNSEATIVRESLERVGALRAEIEKVRRDADESLNGVVSDPPQWLHHDAWRGAIESLYVHRLRNCGDNVSCAARDTVRKAGHLTEMLRRYAADRANGVSAAEARKRHAWNEWSEAMVDGYEKASEGLVEPYDASGDIRAENERLRNELNAARVAMVTAERRLSDQMSGHAPSEPWNVGAVTAVHALLHDDAR